MRKNDKPIKDILQIVFAGNDKITSGIATVKIEEVYREVMGDVVYSYTTDISLKKNTLQIKVQSAPLRAELMNDRQKLMAILNEKLGNDIIKEVKIR